MKQEFSAGGIVFNKDQVLLTCNNKGYWQFPKGHLEKDESSQEAALREVKEEGGVAAEIIAKVGISKYIFSLDSKEKILKIVTIFLMKYLSGDPKDHDFEVSDIGWFNPKEALVKLTFPTDRELLEKALKIKK